MSSISSAQYMGGQPRVCHATIPELTKEQACELFQQEGLVEALFATTGLHPEQAHGLVGGVPGLLLGLCDRSVSVAALQDGADSDIAAYLKLHGDHEPALRLLSCTPYAEGITQDAFKTACKDSAIKPRDVCDEQSALHYDLQSERYVFHSLCHYYHEQKLFSAEAKHGASEAWRECRTHCTDRLRTTKFTLNIHFLIVEKFSSNLG